MTERLCFTTCADEGFLEGLEGLVRSVRKFYPPADADIVVFFEGRNDYVAAFCRTHAAELCHFDEIDRWRRPLLQSDRLLNDAGHFYHPRFEPFPDLPHHTDRGPGEIDRVHHLHPLNVKAHCTAYCALVRNADVVVHIDSDAFLLARIDELFARHPEPDTVFAFDDGHEDLPHLERLYGVRPPAGFDAGHYGFNAGIVAYRNGPGVRDLLTDFTFYVDSCYHYTHSGHFGDQGVLRALVAKHHLRGTVNFVKGDGVNWNPTWYRADRLSYDAVRGRWVNDDNGRDQFLWHGAGAEKLWTGRYASPSVNAAWEWVGGRREPAPYDRVTGSLVRPHCQLLCHAIAEHFRPSGRTSLRVLEVGTQYGRTAIAFCAILGAQGFDVLVDSFDIYAPSPDYPTDHATRDEAEANVRAFGLEDRITLHAVDPFEDITPHLGGVPDVVFIDGDHRFKHVAADCVVAAGVVAPDGLILGDDWQLGSVRAAVRIVFGADKVIELNHSLWAVAGSTPVARASLDLNCTVRS
jgi:predicted O-methyltransferase YrrM